MSKNKCGLILTITGILVIIIVSVTISIREYNKNKKEDIIKSNLLSYSKKCVLDKKCSDTVTVKELIEKDYINEETIKLLSDYSTNSYVIYSLREVYLK